MGNEARLSKAKTGLRRCFKAQTGIQLPCLYNQCPPIDNPHLVTEVWMPWFHIHLMADEQYIVHEERASHPGSHVRRKLLVLWSLHCGLKREQAAKLGGGVVQALARQFGITLLFLPSYSPNLNLIER
jgi:hypothetical protein